MKRMFTHAGYIGIAVLLISTVLIGINPTKAGTLPEGFMTPIIAFEFIGSEQEVLDLFGHEAGQARDVLVHKIDLGNTMDFAYMLAYASFLALFSFICFKESGKKWFIVPIVLSAVVLGADALENVQLLSITAKIAAGGYSAELARLHICTWIKWGGLAAIFVSLIPFLWLDGIFGKIISGISAVAAAAALSAFMSRGVLNEIYGLLVALVFVLLIVFSFTYKKKTVQ